MPGKQPQHDFFSMYGRQTGHPYVEFTIASVEKNTTVLRQTLLGYIQIRQNLNLIDQSGIIFFLDHIPFQQTAVYPETYPTPLLIGFKMNITRIRPVSFLYQTTQKIPFFSGRYRRLCLPCKTTGPIPIILPHPSPELSLFETVYPNLYTSDNFNFLQSIPIIPPFFSITTKLFLPLLPEIHRDKNHPCVVLWSLGNEPDLEHFPQDAYDYWHPLYELAHQLDPQDRPVTLVCCQNDYTKDITTRTMDIVCINRYYGWYNLSGDMDAACYGLNQELDFWAEQHKPVMMSEYGADTVAGLHTAGAEMFSEEFQVEFYRRLDAEFDKRPWFVGEFVWNFADYDTVQGPMRVDGNKKGLFTRDRRPKLGMHFLRQRWAEIPTFGFKE